MEQNYQINSKKLNAIVMKKLIKYSIIFALGIALIACDNDKFPGQVSVKENVSFKLDIQPILTQECATCHNPLETNPDLREGYAYNSLKNLPAGSIIPGNAGGSELMDMLKGGGNNPMPPGATMSPDKIALIQKWINGGALNN